MREIKIRFVRLSHIVSMVMAMVIVVGLPLVAPAGLTERASAFQASDVSKLKFLANNQQTADRSDKSAAKPAPKPQYTQIIRQDVDCTLVACISLSFDDGPRAATTQRILETLADKQVRATFYVLGQEIEGDEKLLQRMHGEGHEIGNHSWDHKDFTALTPDEMRQQVDMTQDALTRAGVPAATQFRPPYGSFNQTVQDTVPMPIVVWNEDAEDWKAGSAAEVIHNVVAHAQPGGLVVMHDIQESTAEALPMLIDVLRAGGYYIVPAGQLLGLTPDMRGVQYGRHAGQ